MLLYRLSKILIFAIEKVKLPLQTTWTKKIPQNPNKNISLFLKLIRDTHPLAIFDRRRCTWEFRWSDCARTPPCSRTPDIVRRCPKSRCRYPSWAAGINWRTVNWFWVVVEGAEAGHEVRERERKRLGATRTSGKSYLALFTGHTLCFNPIVGTQITRLPLKFSGHWKIAKKKKNRKKRIFFGRTFPDKNDEKKTETNWKSKQKINGYSWPRRSMAFQPTITATDSPNSSCDAAQRLCVMCSDGVLVSRDPNR